MAKKIKTRIKLSAELGLAHNSRKDVRTLGKAVNMLINKVNELVDEIEELRGGNPATEPSALPIAGVGDPVCETCGSFKPISLRKAKCQKYGCPLK